MDILAEMARQMRPIMAETKGLGVAFTAVLD